MVVEVAQRSRGEGLVVDQAHVLGFEDLVLPLDRGGREEKSKNEHEAEDSRHQGLL